MKSSASNCEHVHSNFIWDERQKCWRFLKWLLVRLKKNQNSFWNVLSLWCKRSSAFLCFAFLLDVWISAALSMWSSPHDCVLCWTFQLCHWHRDTFQIFLWLSASKYPSAFTWYWGFESLSMGCIVQPKVSLI